MDTLLQPRELSVDNLYIVFYLYIDFLRGTQDSKRKCYCQEESTVCKGILPTLLDVLDSPESCISFQSFSEKN